MLWIMIRVAVCLMYADVDLERALKIAVWRVFSHLGMSALWVVDLHNSGTGEGQWFYRAGTQQLSCWHPGFAFAFLSRRDFIIFPLDTSLRVSITVFFTVFLFFFHCFLSDSTRQGGAEITVIIYFVAEIKRIVVGRVHAKLFLPSSHREFF